MKVAADPRRDRDGPILHLVTAMEPAPAGDKVTTLCGQSFVSFAVRDEDLDNALRRCLCLPCARAFYK